MVLCPAQSWAWASTLQVQRDSGTKENHKLKLLFQVKMPNLKQQRLHQRLDDLLNRKLPVMPPPPVTNGPLLDTVIEDATGNTDPIQHVDDDVNEEIHHNSTPSVAMSRLYDNWHTVIPSIIQPYLQYLAETIGKQAHFPPLPLF